MNETLLRRYLIRTAHEMFKNPRHIITQSFIQYYVLLLDDNGGDGYTVLAKGTLCVVVTAVGPMSTGSYFSFIFALFARHVERGCVYRVGT